MASGFSSSARPPPADPLERQLACSICMDMFVEPVTTSCGHSFCRACLDRSLRLNSSTCPLCKGWLNRTPDVNIVMRNVIEEIKKEREEEEVRRREREEEEVRSREREEEEEMRRREREEEEVRRLREEEELRKVRMEEEVRRRVAEEKELWRREREEEEKRRKEEEERREWEKQQEEERRKREEEECDPRRFRGRPGQVACNICTKMAATKSCLICLVSYCDEHLQIHAANGRLKGHKLVDPVEDLDQRACLTHGRPLELYSRKQNKCICVLCMEKGEEGVVSTEDEWTNKMAKLKDTIEDLKENIMKRKTKMEEINASLKSCKDQLDTEWWDIDAIFSAALAALEAAQAKALRPVEERRQRLTQEASHLCEALQTEMTTLEMAISELNHISTFEDHVLFLQKYPSVKEPGVKDWTAVELDTCVNFGSLRKITAAAMEQIQGHLDDLTALELKRLMKFAVDVTLDPNSSHKRLVLSKDQKEVIDGDTEQEVSDDVERFDVFGSILGTEGQDSGSRAYWEVQVGGKSGWDLGVASAKANRKGKLTLSPDEGYWAIVHYDGDKYAALTAPPVFVQLKHNPQKVGVFLDHDEGLLSFYNVVEKAHMYSFTEADFKGEVLPYFSPHVKNETNTGALIISTLNSS